MLLRKLRGPIDFEWALRDNMNVRLPIEERDSDISLDNSYLTDLYLTLYPYYDESINLYCLSKIEIIQLFLFFINL